MPFRENLRILLLITSQDNVTSLMHYTFLSLLRHILMQLKLQLKKEYHCPTCHYSITWFCGQKNTHNIHTIPVRELGSAFRCCSNYHMSFLITLYYDKDQGKKIVQCSNFCVGVGGQTHYHSLCHLSTTGRQVPKITVSFQNVPIMLCKQCNQRKN